MKNQIKENKELAYAFLGLLATYAICWSFAYAVTALYALGSRITWTFVVIVYIISILVSAYVIYLCVKWGIHKPTVVGQRKFLGFIPNIKVSVFSIFFIILAMVNIWAILSIFADHIMGQ
jgi:hypothetical protein